MAVLMDMLRDRETRAVYPDVPSSQARSQKSSTEDSPEQAGASRGSVGRDRAPRPAANADGKADESAASMASSDVKAAMKRLSELESQLAAMKRAGGAASST